MKLRLSSLRLSRWLLLSFLGVVLLPLIHAFQLSRVYVEDLQQQQRQAVARRLGNTVQSLNERVGRVKAALEVLAQSDAVQAGDWASLYRHAKRVVEKNDPLSAISLVGRDQNLVFATVVPFDAVQPPAARWEDAARVLDTGNAVLSGPFMPPYENLADSRPVVSVGVPVRSNGKVTHVLRGILRADSLLPLLAGEHMPAEWHAMLVDRAGNVITRTSQGQPLGADKLEISLLEAIRAGGSVSYRLGDGDGETMLLQLADLPGGDWSVLLGLSEKNLAALTYETRRNIVFFYLLVTLGVIFAVGVIARYFGSQLRRIVGYARQVSENQTAEPIVSEVLELQHLAMELGNLASNQSRLLGEIRNREELLKSLVEHMPVGLAMLDRQFCYVSVNQVWYEVFGLPPEPLAGQSHYAIFPNLPQGFMVDHQNAMGGQDMPPSEYCLGSQHGVSRWVRRQVLPWRNGEGDIVGIVIFAEDISTEVAARQALQEANAELERKVADRTLALAAALTEVSDERQRFLSILDTLPVIVAIIRADHRLDWANQAYRQALGQNDGKLCYASQFGFDSPCVECQAFMPLQTGKPHHWEWTLPGGQTYDIYNYPFVAADGTPAILELSIDISEQRRASAVMQSVNETLERLITERTAALLAAGQRLEKVNKQFSLAMDAAREGIWDWDMASGEVYYSPGYAAMLGLTPDSLEPNFAAWRKLLHVEDAERVTQEADRALRHEGNYAGEFRMRRYDGEYIWVISRGRVVEWDTAGLPTRAVGTHVDITALKEARLKAEAASQAKSEFLANMSHEIRTPLNGIIGMANIICKGGLSPRQNEQMGKLLVASNHLLGILTDILDLSKIEAGKMEIGRQPIDVRRLVDEVCAIVQEDVHRKALQFEILPMHLPPALLGDAVRIRQALLNLVGNAVKFTHHGSIRLRVEAQNEDASGMQVRFEVEDSGVGVAPDVLPRLFSAFEQADNSSTRKFGGTGLGLALVRRLARLMGGDAGASSTPGVGSLFWFTARLDRVTEDLVTVSESEISPQDAADTLKQCFSGRRVLIAEDEMLNRMIAESLVTDVGLLADMAEDGVEAVRMLQENNYDLVLMDMSMPNMSGIDATREIRTTLSSRIPIIAVTANTFDSDRRACLEAGMDDFLGKPIDPDALYAKILFWLKK